jgi:hypothetical protein
LHGLVSLLGLFVAWLGSLGGLAEPMSEGPDMGHPVLCR